MVGEAVEALESIEPERYKGRERVQLVCQVVGKFRGEWFAEGELVSSQKEKPGAAEKPRR